MGFTVFKASAYHISLSHSFNLSDSELVAELVKDCEEFIEELDEFLWRMGCADVIEVVDIAKQNSDGSLVFCNIPYTLSHTIFYEFRKQIA